MEAMLIERSHVGKECPLRREACFTCQPVQDLSLEEALLRIASPSKGRMTIKLHTLRSFEEFEPRASISSVLLPFALPLPFDSLLSQPLREFLHRFRWTLSV